MDATHLDRQAVETLFGGGPRRAHQLMAGLAGIRVGNAVAVSRLALLERMEATAETGAYQWEVARRARVVEELERTLRELPARRVRIPLPPNAEHRRFGDLPAAIEIRPGDLRVAFSGAEELAAKLVELSQAMAHAWNGFVRAVEE